MTSALIKCASCGGSKLIFGSFQSGLHALRFIPEGAGLFASGLPVRAFLCRECGSLGFQVSPERLSSLEPRERPGMGLS